MQEQLIIRVPVIISMLPALRHYQTTGNYSIPEPFQCTEDIRIKIRHHSIQLQGRSLQVIFDIELLLLVKDPSGRSSLIKYDERLRDRIAISTLDPVLDVSEAMEFYIDMEYFNWDGEMKGQELIIRYYLKYNLMVAIQQAVSLQGQTQLIHDQPCAFTAEDENSQQLWLENASLRRKISLLEKDLSLLKRSLQKWRQKLSLKQELRSSQEEKNRLSEKLVSRETLLQQYQQQVNNLREQELQKDPQQAYVGRRLKKLLGFSL